MKKLDKTVTVRGVGVPGLTATLVKRTENICMYLRSDGYFETFIVRIEPEGEIFGRPLPEREVYPNNEDFGRTAYCTKSIEKAEKTYLRLTHHAQKLKA